MKITSLSVEGAGRFGTPVSVQGLGAGVNILAAGNEAGKSTLFRAIRACLFERHGTSNRWVGRMCTTGLSLPLSVTLGFDQGGEAYTIRKSFIRSPSATLRRNGVEIARGRQADEDLWEIIGVAPGSGRAVDEAAFGLLWVGQGHSFAVPGVTGAFADELSAIVQQEVGTLVGGERARSVLAKVKTEIDEQLTPATGRVRANGPLGRALAVVEQDEQALTQVRRRLQEADGHITSLDERVGERERLGDPATGSGIQRELTGAETNLAAAREAKAALARVEAEEQRASVAEDNAARALSDLKACISRIEASRARENAIGAEMAPLATRVAEADGILADARTKVQTLGDDAKADDAAEQRLTALAAALTGQSSRADVRTRLDLLSDINGRLGPIEADLATNAATAAAVTQVDGFERELATLAARLDAGAAQLLVELGQGGAGQVKVGDEIVVGSAARAILASTVVRVGSLATITANPPSAFGAEEFAQRDRLEAELAKVLNEANAASPAELRAAHARRRQLEDHQTAILAELRALRVERKVLAEEIDRVTANLAAADAAITAALGAAGLPELPDAEEIRSQQLALAGRRAAAALERGRLAGITDAQNNVRTECSAAMGQLKGERDEILRTRQGDLATVPDDTRAVSLASAAKKFDEAGEAHTVCTRAVARQRDLTPSDDEVGRLENRIVRLRTAIEGQRATAGRLEKDIARLEGQIAAIGAEGLGEKGAALADELDLCTREADRLRARVDMLVLLRDTIERCYQEQRDRLNAPVAKHLQPFLSDLFPSATPEMGDAFAITGLRRDGNLSEPFEILSDGTQEQIAVLVRLAMGSMLCERGEPVPIILDDALVFSDDDRIERMFDALSRAGQKQQVIVLTCRTRTFATLGGHQLSIER